jgi:hypothetical protein
MPSSSRLIHVARVRRMRSCQCEPQVKKPVEKQKRFRFAIADVETQMVESPFATILRARGESMNLTGVVQQLRKERDRAQTELSRLDSALAALGSLNSGFRGVRPEKRKVSAAARARVAAAQRARRAREKGVLIPIQAKRRISRAGLASIRAAQRARWAKWKKQQKAA